MHSTCRTPSVACGYQFRCTVAVVSEISMSAAGASSNAAVASNDSTTKLHDMMSFQADVELVFDKARSADRDRTLLAHSNILRMHSGVISNALDTEGDSQGRGCNKPRKVSMPGSLKADFLKVAPFMYPVVPLPEVSWDNLETLLTEGRKWDMTVVLAHADRFIQSNAASLDMQAESQRFAFKWLNLADAAGLKDAVKVCVDRIVSSGPSLCTEDRLQGLSPNTLQQMVMQMVKSGTAGVSRYCNCCGRYV